MSCFVAFHYRSYGTFFLQQNRLHNIHRGFTHYKYYRAITFGIASFSLLPYIQINKMIFYRAVLARKRLKA